MTECKLCKHEITAHFPKDLTNELFRIFVAEKYNRVTKKLEIDEDKLINEYPYGHCGICNDKYLDLPKRDDETFFPCQFF